MKKSQFSDSHILAILKQHESGIPVAKLSREHSGSTALNYQGRAKFGGKGPPLIKRIKELKQIIFVSVRRSHLVRQKAPTSCATGVRRWRCSSASADGPARPTGNASAPPNVSGRSPGLWPCLGRPGLFAVARSSIGGERRRWAGQPFSVSGPRPDETVLSVFRSITTRYFLLWFGRSLRESWADWPCSRAQ